MLKMLKMLKMFRSQMLMLMITTFAPSRWLRQNVEMTQHFSRWLSTFFDVDVDADVEMFDVLPPVDGSGKRRRIFVSFMSRCRDVEVKMTQHIFSRCRSRDDSAHISMSMSMLTMMLTLMFLWMLNDPLNDPIVNFWKLEISGVFFVALLLLLRHYTINMSDFVIDILTIFLMQ